MNLAPRRRVAWTIVLVLALLPLASIVILGSHGRLMGDDFCHLVSGQEYGPWGNVLYWRNSFNGSFSYYFLHGLTAPLDTRAASVFVLVIIVVWTFSQAWLIYAGHQLFGQDKPPLAWIIVVAAALVWLTIHGLPSSLSIYWYSAATRHTLPIAILSIALAACCAFAPRIQSIRRLALACAIFALVAFVNAGMSEVFAVVQFALFTILLPAAYAMTPRESRRNCLLLCRSGWVATLAGLLVMATAPGVAIRLAGSDSSLNSPQASPANLFPNTLEHLQSFFIDTELNTAFIGMLVITLAIMVTVRRSTQPKSIGEPFQLAAPPLLLCLIAQLLLVPLVWTNQSDNPLVFGRFNPAHLVVVCTQLLLLTSLSAILIARARINSILQNKAEYWAVITALTLSVVFIMVGAAQFRSMNWRAAGYVYCSIFTLLFALLWQFHFHFQATGRKGRFFEAVIWVCIALGASVIALVALSQATTIEQYEYGLSFIAFAFAFAGFICGISLAYAINQANATTPAIRPTLVIVFGSALVASAIWSGVMLGNAKHIPEFGRFSRAWDERHQLILSKRESGELLEEPPRLPTEILDIPGGFWGYDYWLSWCASDEITELIKGRYQA